LAVVHRVYAEALLGAARDKDRVDAIRREFDEFAAGLDESGELRRFLANPQIESRTKGAVLGDLLGDADQLFVNFLRLLAEKDRIGEISEVHAEWTRLLAREERVLELELTTAIELSDEEAERVVKQIEEASGRRVVATRTVEPDLIGGLVLQAGSLRLDASVRGRLEQLREELTTA
jgi:F-type H+-transporting ATPase subunit delta